MNTMFYVRYKLKLYIQFKYILIVSEPQIFEYFPFKNKKMGRKTLLLLLKMGATRLS